MLPCPAPARTCAFVAWAGVADKDRDDCPRQRATCATLIAPSLPPFSADRDSRVLHCLCFISDVNRANLFSFLRFLLPCLLSLLQGAHLLATIAAQVGHADTEQLGQRRDEAREDGDDRAQPGGQGEGQGKQGHNRAFAEDQATR